MDSETAEQLNVFSNYVRRKGLRMTRQRELVVQTFLEAEGHLSTEELYSLVKRRDLRVGYATVSRTLKALTDCGLARRTDLDDGLVRYEHLYRRPHHHHIVCLECGRTIEFSIPELEELQSRIVSKYGFKAVRNRFQVFGVCLECQGTDAEVEAAHDSDLIFARDALQIAMETEKRGVNFYRTAAELVTSETTRSTFLAMLEEEHTHLAGLEKEWKRLLEGRSDILKAPVFLHFDYEALKRIFPSREEIQKKLNKEISEREALRLAMSMEKDARDFFRNYAEKFNDTKGRDIFLKFAAEEEDHYTIIKSALERLQSPSTNTRSAGRQA